MIAADSGADTSHRAELTDDILGKHFAERHEFRVSGGIDDHVGWKFSAIAQDDAPFADSRWIPKNPAGRRPLATDPAKPISDKSAIATQGEKFDRPSVIKFTQAKRNPAREWEQRNASFG